MASFVLLYDRAVAVAAGPCATGLALLVSRVALAGIFWRSGRTKIEDGTLFTTSENARFLFEYEYVGLPLPVSISAPMATVAEHVFPVLLVLGLATRLSALGLLVMTLVIQLFVYPDAWWTTHIVWAALALVLICRGGGLLSADHLLALRRGRR